MQDLQEDFIIDDDPKTRPYDERLKQFWNHNMCPITGHQFQKGELAREDLEGYFIQSIPIPKTSHNQYKRIKDS